MASFRLKFEEGIKSRGIEVTYDLSSRSDAVLVIAGTRNLLPLHQSRKRGVRIVQRLDGINWVQRVRWTDPRYLIRAEYGNAMLALIRRRFADRVIYQSEFIRSWWNDWYGEAKVPSTVILNGINLERYSPEGEHDRPTDLFRLLLLEGSLAGGLNSGLFHGVALAEKLAKKHPIEVVVAGKEGIRGHEVHRRVIALVFRVGVQAPANVIDAVGHREHGGLVREDISFQPLEAAGCRVAALA